VPLPLRRLVSDWGQALCGIVDQAAHTRVPRRRGKAWEKAGEDEVGISTVVDGGDTAPALAHALGGEETVDQGVALADLVEVGTGMDADAGLATDVLTPFLGTYPGSVECRSARKGNSDWSAGELPIRVVADEETAECG